MSQIADNLYLIIPIGAAIFFMAVVAFVRIEEVMRHP